MKRQLQPTKRQLDAFFWRCTGLTYREVGLRMGIGEKAACLLACGAAGRLILLPPSPAVATNRTLAFHHFPKIAFAHGKTLEEAQ